MGLMSMLRGDVAFRPFGPCLMLVIAVFVKLVWLGVSALFLESDNMWLRLGLGGGGTTANTLG